MDLIFWFMGGLCIAEGIDLFMGKDFMIFVGTNVDKSDYDVDKCTRLRNGCSWPTRC